MKLEEQVVSLDLAKRLKELGVKQKSCFHWVEFEKDHKIYRTVWEAKELDNTIACAFTVAELGEILKNFPFLPRPCFINEHIFWKINDEYSDGFTEEKYGKAIDYFFSKSEADARAKMLILLLEKGMIINEKNEVQ